MASTPRDRFDDIPDDLVRVGAHRGPAKRGRGWVRLAWAALATGVLIVGGLYGLTRINPSISIELPDFGTEATPTATPTPRPEVEPVTDPSTVDRKLNLDITVLNATETPGLQNVAGDQIFAAKWPDPVRGSASARDREVTVIYYWNADFEGIAKGLALLLGLETTQVAMSDAYGGAPVTIVLGSDYSGPQS